MRTDNQKLEKFKYNIERERRITSKLSQNIHSPFFTFVVILYNFLNIPIIFLLSGIALWNHHGYQIPLILIIGIPFFLSLIPQERI